MAQGTQITFEDHDVEQYFFYKGFLASLVNMSNVC